MKNMDLKTEVAKLFSYGIATQALIKLDAMGVLKDIIETPFRVETSSSSPNTREQTTIESSLNVLSYAGLVTAHENSYILTPMGREVIHSIDEFKLWFGAYGPLMSSSFSEPSVRIDGRLVAHASSGIGKKCVDPYLTNILDKLEIRGDICDLGCGNGLRLQKICAQLNKNGIGIDVSIDAIKDAKVRSENVFSKKSIDFICKDVTKLDEVFPSIDFLLQTFMTHHIVPDAHCVEVFSSYKDKFPFARYFLVLDTVTPEDIGSTPELFTPGFMFAHGLQGLLARRRENLLKVFNDADFTLIEETKLGVPNSYAWLLSFNRL